MARAPGASGVAVDIESSGLEGAEPMHAVGAALGVDPMSFVLGGGEDHALAATFPQGVELPEGFRRVGSVTAVEGVTVDGEPFEGAGGHDHFAG